jgi:hypothetical protein
VAEPVVHFRNQNRLIDACGVLEGDKLHGIAVLAGFAGRGPGQ